MSKEDGRIVSAYLKSLKTGRGNRARNPESLQSQLDRINKKLNGNLGEVAKLKLYQKQIEVQKHLGVAKKKQSQGMDKKKLEEGFVRIASAYSKENKISNTAWRRIGVPGHVLVKAGLAKPRK